jgi:hypothetical protein
MGGTVVQGPATAGDLELAPATSESKRIAGLVGPTLIALSASEALNYRIWNDNQAPVTYLDGALLFVGGLSIVRAHNRWARGWPLLTTLAGWSALALGLVRMFAPETRQPERNAAIDGVLAAMFASGLVLTCKAYRPATDQR